MLETRNRNAWIWVAIAAFALATAGSAGSGFQSARACVQPAVAQLIASASQSAVVRGEALHLYSRTSHRSHSNLVSSVAIGAFSLAFPVLFIGLLLPPTLVSPAYASNFLRVPSAPPLPAAFQRPPPVLLG